ncbi:MAG: hypothetical protein RIE86_23910 [Imperialibacter sp.]|uniref:hypothetical protein n=1 Tax=Imperialibacter sp. TaxID=2038411 RepID=UPI0032EC0D27
MKNYIGRTNRYTIPNVFKYSYSFKIPSGTDLLIKITLISPPFFLRGFYWLGIGFPPYLSPAYIFFPLTLGLFVWALLKDDRTSYLSFAFAFYQVIAIGLLIIQIVLFSLNYGLANEIGRVVFPPIYFFVCYTIFKRYPKDKVNEYFLFFVKSGVVLMSIETLIRIFVIFPRMLGLTSLFYALKPSLFFMDSNFTGFILVTYLSLVYYYRFNFKKEVFKNDILIISILILMTMSRSSIAAAFIIYFYAYFLRVGKLTKMTILILGVSIISILIPIVAKDGSFKTKIKIMGYFGDWIASSTEKLLFGIGSGNMSLAYNVGSHNLVGLTIELGFVWLAIYLGMFFCAWYSIGKSIIWLLMPMFVAGALSLYPITYTGVVFIGFVFMILLNSFKR